MHQGRAVAPPLVLIEAAELGLRNTRRDDERWRQASSPSVQRARRGSSSFSRW
jgi:hypothetical protein